MPFRPFDPAAREYVAKFSRRTNVCEHCGRYDADITEEGKQVYVAAFHLAEQREHDTVLLSDVKDAERDLA
jgi:hypothetical protein